MPNGNIVVTEERGTRVITLRRPSKKNAITQDMYREMSRAIDTAQNNPDIRCMIITGGSGVFTAGDDIDDFMQGRRVASRDAVGRRQIPVFAGPQRQADHRGRGRRLDRHGHRDAVSLRLRAGLQRRDLLGALHQSRARAGRRLQPADAEHHGLPARLRHAGDGTQLHRRRGPCRRLRQHRGVAGTYRGRGAQGGARDLPAAGRSGRNLAQAAARRRRKNSPAASTRKPICSASG